MPWLVALCLALASWLAPAGPVQAGSISLSTTVSASVTGPALRVEVVLVNQGDEAARDLSLILEAAGGRVEAPGPASLPPREPWRTNLELPLGPDQPGAYPAIVRVRFHDLNGYAFSSLAHGLFHRQAPSQAGVTLQGLASRVADQGIIRFELANPDPVAHLVSLRAAGPEELALAEPPARLELAPGSRQSLDLPARNLTALAGASYPVLLILEYEHHGRRHSAVGVALVTVQASPDLVRAAIPYLYALAALLVAAMLWLQLRARRAAGRWS